MGFGIYVIPWRGGVASTLKRAIVEQAFKPLVTCDLSDDYWNLTIPPDTEICSGSVFISEGVDINSVYIDRPPFTLQFWDALYEVLRQTLTVLIWPTEGAGICAANPAVLAHVAPQLREDYPDIPIVGSGQDIEDCFIRDG